MELLRVAHGGLARMSLLYFLALAFWGYWRFFRKQGVDSSYWGGLAIGEVIVVLQSLIGFAMFFYGSSPARSIHILYGLLAPAAIPFVYFYTKGRDNRAEILVYGIATLFAAAFVMRAMFTGA
ncbi:MAG: hypothetical protein N2D54_05045 [Chloroflexota bacterium]